MSDKKDSFEEHISEEKKAEIQKLIKTLGDKYNLKKPNADKQASKEVSSSINDEIASKVFIDVEEYSKTRSRYIENKYGLKPLNEIISPRTDDEKRQELEEYLKKSDNMLYGDAVKKASNKLASLKSSVNKEVGELRKEEEAYPVQYKWLEDLPGYKPEVNIGQKWANALEENVKRDQELSQGLRRGGYIYQSWKKGKVGVDKYFILFGLFGAMLVPLYIYNRHKTYKEFILQERGLKPGEELDLENGPFELDEISYHKDWMDDKEEKVKSYAKLQRKKEIRKLEEEIYGKDAFGASRNY